MAARRALNAEKAGRNRSGLPLTSTTVACNATACASLPTPKRWRGHDRLVDTQPAGRGCTPTGMVLGRDIPSGVEVGMQREATRLTTEPPTGAPACAGRMPAAAARLRVMLWIDGDHRQAALLGLVRDKRLQLRERPRVNPAFGFGLALGLHAPPDVLQVFQHDRPAHLDRLHDLLAQNVVAVAPEPSLLPPHFPQVALGRARSLLLQLPPKVEQSPLDRLPAPFPEEPAGGGDSGTSEAQIDADDLIGRLHFRAENSDDHMQPPPATAEDHIGRVGGAARILGRIRRQGEANRLPDAGRREIDRPALPIYAEGMHIVTGREGMRVRLADLSLDLLSLVFSPQRQRALERLGRLHPRLYGQVAHQGGIIGLERVIQRTVQFDAVLLAVLPAYRSHSIEHRRKLATGFRQGIGLNGRRLKKDTDRALHMGNIPYAEHTFKYDMARHFLCRLQADNLRAVARLYQYDRSSFLMAGVLLS